MIDVRERIHLDFAEVNKQMFLVVMDVYPHWPGRPLQPAKLLKF